MTERPGGTAGEFAGMAGEGLEVREQGGHGVPGDQGLPGPGGRLPPHRRAPYRTRRSRQTMTFLGLVGAVLLIGFIAYLSYQGIMPIGGDGRPASQTCPAPVQTAAAASATKVNIYNASSTRGLGSAVAHEMQLRGFRVPAIANAPTGTKIKGTVQIRYGAQGRLQARTVTAQFRGAVDLVQDETSTDDTITLFIGATYHGMGPVPEVLTRLAQRPAPSLTGCVPVSADKSPAPLVNDPRPPKPSPTKSR